MQTNITAILLAAGFSSRMGMFKPLLPLGETTPLKRSIRLFRDAGVFDIRVVVGHGSQEMLPLLHKIGVRSILNPDYASGMFSSVVAGISELEPETEAFFILPVDIPLIRSLTIRRLLQVFQKGAGQILHPSFGNQRGHPPLIDRVYADAIVGWDGPLGLKGVLERFEAHAVDIEVPDECILLDMDTPEDYRTVLDLLQHHDIPSAKECEILLKRVLAVEERIIRHCQAVARLAVAIATALNAAGCRLNLNLIRAAGLLHDVVKGRPAHAQRGAEILKDMGFPRVAEIVATHMDIEVTKAKPIDEREIVYLADKMTCGDQISIDFKERFEHKKHRYAAHPDSQQAIVRRLENAQTIQKRIETQLARPLARICEMNLSGADPY